MSSTNNNNLMPATSATATGLTANPERKKISLAKGYSLMDWIRFTKTAANEDLTGTSSSQPKSITYQELAKHNKRDDCWLAVYGKVYNVTAYMKFHPGGVDELMKGAGMNATQLFNDVG